MYTNFSLTTNVLSGTNRTHDISRANTRLPKSTKLNYHFSITVLAIFNVNIVPSQWNQNLSCQGKLSLHWIRPTADPGGGLIIGVKFFGGMSYHWY